MPDRAGRRGGAGREFARTRGRTLAAAEHTAPTATATVAACRRRGRSRFPRPATMVSDPRRTAPRPASSSRSPASRARRPRSSSTRPANVPIGVVTRLRVEQGGTLWSGAIPPWGGRSLTGDAARHGLRTQAAGDAAAVLGSSVACRARTTAGGCCAIAASGSAGQHGEETATMGARDIAGHRGGTGPTTWRVAGRWATFTGAANARALRGRRARTDALSL